ncbi:hypothetical protein CEXT_669581 [Caerostris extrusa]|uniref:Uncharacterized protein n=1 Tax=Caerostris extrusa TaxID=172846 RepID=A0AAV4XYI5_CAEEX|nr:hypothetical protein CEXT_669581 [Caerostris extrusa]
MKFYKGDCFVKRKKNTALTKREKEKKKKSRDSFVQKIKSDLNIGRDVFASFLFQAHKIFFRTAWFVSQRCTYWITLPYPGLLSWLRESGPE